MDKNTKPTINLTEELHSENKMGTQSIGKLLLSMSLPMMVSMLVLALYNVVDSIFVARVSDNALTGLSLAFPFQMLITGICVGTGIGVNSLVARKLGEKDSEYANRTASTGIVLAVISGIIMSIIFFFFSETFMSWFTDDADILKQATTYLRIYGSLCTFITVCVVCEKTLQGTGNALHPMLIQLVGAITNIILDPILIFGFGGIKPMGVAGAAIATVAGEFVSLLFALYYLLFCKRNKVLKISFRKFKFDWGIIGGIYAVAVASILMQTVASFTTVILNALLIAFTPIAVNVLGVYFKIQSFIFMPVFGLSSGAMPILAYNYGSRNKERFMKTLKLSTLLSLGIMLLGLAVFHAIPEVLLAMFNADSAMLAMGVHALRTISICFPFAALGIMFITTFNAVGKGGFSLVLSVLRQFVIIIPAAYLLSKAFGIYAIWYAYPIAEIVGASLGAALLVVTYKTKIKHLRPSTELPPIR